MTTKPWHDRRQQIGNAVVYLGDCFEILPHVGRIDLICADPPYGIGQDRGVGSSNGKAGGQARSSKSYEGGWDKSPPTKEQLAKLASCAPALLLWGANYYAHSLPRRGGQWLVWDKQNSMPSYSDADLAWQHPGGQATKMIRYLFQGFHANRDGERVHPTQKPVEVMAWCLARFPDAPVVCDPFMGSGSTGVAALRDGRRFIGIEREPAYFEGACARLAAAAAAPDMFAAHAPVTAPQQQALFPGVDKEGLQL